jgi:hypothetical protein
MSQFLAVLFIFLPAIVGISNCVTDHEDDPSFRITTKRGDDRVEVSIEGGKAAFSVQSPFGISHAVIERIGNHWPDAVTLNLHLGGLESFKITNGATTIDAMVSSQDGKVRQWKDGKEDSQLDVDNPYWIEIRMIGKDEKSVKSLSLNNGYFRLRLPKALFESNPKSITVNWLDFYR